MSVTALRLAWKHKNGLDEFSVHADTDAVIQYVREDYERARTTLSADRFEWKKFNLRHGITVDIVELPDDSVTGKNLSKGGRVVIADQFYAGSNSDSYDDDLWDEVKGLNVVGSVRIDLPFVEPWQGVEPGGRPSAADWQRELLAMPGPG